MLKIKDNVDLKELEKYGFEINDSCVNDRYKFIMNKNLNWLIVKGISRKLVIDCSNSYICELDILYDLIQAGLVEKVNE